MQCNEPGWNSYPLIAAALFLASCGGGNSDNDFAASGAALDTQPPGIPSTPNNDSGSPVADGEMSPQETLESPVASAPVSDAATSATPVSLPPEPEPETEPPIDDEANAFFFSYDESTSTAGRDLSLFAIDNGFRPAPQLGRAFEFLNAESFEPFDSQPVGPFSVSMGMLSASNADLPTSIATQDSLYALGVNLVGPEQTREQRRNVVLTLLVDVSGSMDSLYASETRSDIRSLLDVARFGLSQLPQSLKAGDVVNLVKFSSDAEIILEGNSGQGFEFTNAVNGLVTEGSTNINTGLNLAYEVANRNFDPQKANRVLIVTDAFVNTGEINPDIIARQTVINELEGIYFSGIGVGSGFNDTVLDTLTDVGKGSYTAMITPNDGERLFTDGFMQFVEPALTDVMFQLSYPQQLNQFQSAAEEISVNAQDIQPVNFSYNSDQYFLEIFTGPEDINTDQDVTLNIIYTDPQGQQSTASLAVSLDQLFTQGEQSIRSAAMVSTLANVIAESVSCDEALNSLLYINSIDDTVYSRYRDALTDYCSQPEPYNFVTY